MAVASSLLPPPDMPICRKYIYCGQFKGLVDKTPLYSFQLPLSSHSVRQDALSFYVLNNLHGPISPGCANFNGLLCRSLLKPSGGNEIPVLKAAATIISRSYSNLQSSPLVLQLVPAVGILAFAACGLVPLMCFGRTIFLNKTDSSWKKSGTYYVTTSYLQPLLLWTGAMLVCRALEPLILSSIASQAVKQRLLNFVRSLATVLAFAYCLSSLIQQTQKFFVQTKDSADTSSMGFDFAGKAVYTAVWVAAASLFMELLGFSTQKWLTAGGLGTVLLTLAGREILTNFLSSVMIHATQPFVLNDWIQTKIEGYEVSGSVEHVGWWSPTVIRGDDREAIHIPSHKFTVNVVRNLTQRTHWRVKTHLAISHLDVNKINIIVADMRKVLAKNPQVEQQKLHRRVFLDNVDSETQALKIMVSCFVKTSRFEEYLCVKESLLLDLLRVISHHRARLATPIRTVQKVYGEPDVETIPFSDTIFTRPKAASDRPVLLLGASYKVNNEIKTRTPDEGEDEKIEATSPSSDSQVEAKTEPASILNDGKVEGKGYFGSNSDGNSKTTIVAVSMPDKLKYLDSIDSGECVSVKQTQDSAVASPKVDDVLAEGKKDFPGTQRLSIQEQSSNEAAVASTASQAMPDVGRQIPSPSTSKTSLEDNIVLGVALEGSKMTLPIEEEFMTPPTLSEVELAAVGTDKQNDIDEAPSTGPLDQRAKRKVN